MNLNVGQLVKVKTNHLLNIDIINKQKEEYEMDESMYTLTLNTNTFSLISKSTLTLQYQEDGTFKDIYTGTIINYYDEDNNDLTLECINDYKDRYTYYYENPLFIRDYECINKNEIGCLEEAERAKKELGQIYQYVQSTLDEKHQKILEENLSYKKNVKMKIKTLF